MRRNGLHGVRAGLLVALALYALANGGCLAAEPMASGRDGAARLRATETAKTVGLFGNHVVRSMLLGPARRPVTTTGEVMLLAGGAAVDWLRLGTRGMLGKGARRPSEPVAERVPMDLERFEADLDRLTGTRRVLGRAELLVDGNEFFSRYLSALDEARRSVKIRTYIFDNDDFAVSVADLLKVKSREAKVQVMMDGLGTLSGTLFRSPTAPADFHPPRSINRYLKKGSAVRTRFLGNTFGAGDHTKATIIDGEIAYVGGMNIGREYRFDWHDLMVELRGPVVARIEADFDRAWRRTGLWGELSLLSRRQQNSPAPERGGAAGLAPMRLLYTRLHDPQIYRAQLHAIREARRYIYVENAYFSDDLTRRELIRARARGVDVKVVLPFRGDSRIMEKSNVLAANDLWRHGVEVYIYPGMSHVKAMVVDGWASFGSANLDRLSLRVNKELNIATSAPEIVSKLVERVFLADFAVSMRMRAPLDAHWSYRLHELVADLVL